MKKIHCLHECSKQTCPRLNDHGASDLKFTSGMHTGGCPVQVSPRGWQINCGILKLGKKLGYIAYNTRCSCGKSTKWGPPVGGPHTMKQWVEKHGNHRLTTDSTFFESAQCIAVC
jgi:hypothetical protein